MVTGIARAQLVGVNAANTVAAAMNLQRVVAGSADDYAQWKKQLMENLPKFFELEVNPRGQDGAERELELLQQIGELTVERDFLSHAPGLS